MKYFALILCFQFLVILGFSQEKKDTLTKATPQPLRIATTIKSNSTKLSPTKQKVPVNKRVSQVDIINNNKTDKKKIQKPENLRIKK